MSRIAIIPARGGSRRIPRKNIRDFHGKPIMAYSIEAAKASGLFDRIVVSTDDQEIATVAYAYGASAWVRPADLARDEVGTQEVAGYTLFSSAYRDDERFSHACVIYPCAPLMLPDDLTFGFGFLERSGADYAYSVDVSTQKDAGAWYWGRAQAFLQGVPLKPPYAVPCGIDPFRALDINTPEEWAEAERRYAARFSPDIQLALQGKGIL